jgi:hypothetical protein
MAPVQLGWTSVALTSAFTNIEPSDRLGLRQAKLLLTVCRRPKQQPVIGLPRRRRCRSHSPPGPLPCRRVSRVCGRLWAIRPSCSRTEMPSSGPNSSVIRPSLDLEDRGAGGGLVPAGSASLGLDTDPRAMLLSALSDRELPSRGRRGRVRWAAPFVEVSADVHCRVDGPARDAVLREVVLHGSPRQDASSAPVPSEHTSEVA